MGVHAGDDDVHLLENRVGEIERAVGQDIHFNAGENLDVAELVAYGANALDVFDRALVVEAVGESQILRMVGDGHVFVAVLFGGCGHFFDGVASVGFDGVHVDVALQVGLGDQIGQSVGLGGVDFAQIFAQLGRNVVELELGVNLFFGFSRDRFFGVECGQAVLAEGVTHFQRALAQGHVVGLGAGEILHGGAEGFRRQQAHVHLHAAAQTKADFVFAAGDDLHEARKFDDVLDQFFASGVIAAGFAGDQNVEIADGFASAAQRTGGRDFFHAGIIAQMLDDFVGLPFGGVEQKAAGDAAIILDGLEQLLFLLFAHAGKLANLSFFGQLLHAFEIAYLIGAPDESDRLRSQALDLEQVEHGGAIFLEQFGVQRKFALFEHFLHVHQHAFADAGDGEHFLGFVDQVGDLLGLGFDGFGGIAIGADAEGILRRRFRAGRRFRRECRRWLCCPLR